MHKLTPAPEESRRNALRGLFALGCGLFLPALAGCNSRQQQATAPASGPVAAQPPATPSPVAETPATAAPGTAATEQPSSHPAFKKITQDQAHYQDKPKGDHMCAKCSHFIAVSNTCELVEGTVSPLGWCQLWAAKAG